jgi:hypothetical protein
VEGVRRRRFPGQTRDELELLAQLEEIDLEMARKVERIWDRHRRADARFAKHETTGAVADAQHARRAGTGGGRRRPTHNTKND